MVSGLLPISMSYPTTNAGLFGYQTPTSYVDDPDIEAPISTIRWHRSGQPIARLVHLQVRTPFGQSNPVRCVVVLKVRLALILMWWDAMQVLGSQFGPTRDLHLPSSFDFHGIEMSLLNQTMNVRYRLHVRTMYVPYVVAVHISESLLSGFASWRNFRQCRHRDQAGDQVTSQAQS